MIIPRNLYGAKSNMVFCHVSFTKNFVVKLADDYFYNFVNKHSGIVFTDYIHPDYLNEFVSACADLKEGSEVRLLSFISCDNKDYQLVDMVIRNTGKHIGEDQVTDIQICNLYSMENKYTVSNNDAAKYKIYLSMYSDYLFDYDVESGNLSIYTYTSVKATIILKKPLEEFRDIIMKKLGSARQRRDFEDFLNKIICSNEGFEYELIAPLIQDTGKLGKCNVQCKIVYKHNRQRVVIGIIKYPGDGEKDMPYYATPEGKDFFTGLLNKKACKEYVLDTISANDEKHYMAIIDIDNFKSINDTYGHLYGDKVILKVASIINKALNGRGIVGRFGGDEFFIFTNWLNTEKQLRSILTYLKQQIMYEFTDEQVGGKITLSIGVSLYPDNGNDYDSLFNKADKCLYIAKNKGKNRYIIYDPVKHGDFIDDIEKMGGSMLPARNVEIVAERMADIFCRIVQDGKDVIPDILPEACQLFGIGGIRVYMPKTEELLYYHGTYKKLPDIGDIIKKDDFIQKFQGRNFITLVYLANIESIDKEYYIESHESGIGGEIIVYYKNKDGDNIMVFFDTIAEKFNWNETDKNYMLTLAKVIANVL